MRSIVFLILFAFTQQGKLIIGPTAKDIGPGQQSIYFPNRPVLFFHDFGKSCESESLSKLFHCIETGADLIDSTVNIHEQAKIGCQLIKRLIGYKDKNVKKKFKDGFHFLGFGQGGLIARAIYNYCDEVRHLVKRIMTAGTPNLGVSEIPKLKGFDNFAWPLLLYAENCLNDECLMLKWSFYSYLNKEKDHQIEYGPLIRDLIIPEKPNKIRGDLEAIISIRFLKDNTIKPASSTNFGIEYSEKTGSFSDPSKSWISDNKEIMGLIKQDHFIICVIDAENFETNFENFSAALKFLDDSFSYVLDKSEKYNSEEVYRRSFDWKMSGKDIKPLICSYKQKERQLKD